MRDLLKRNPNATFNAEMLAAALSVQLVAARQYFAELKRVGLLNDDGRATEVAKKWRQDDSYDEAVIELIKSVYPDDLTTIAPPGDSERQVVVNWFMSQNLGEGSAKNKASTYILIASGEPGTASGTPATSRERRSTKPAIVGKFTRASSVGASRKGDAVSDADTTDGDAKTPLMPLNVNLQIHISADASNDQIEAIFAAMKKYMQNA